MFWWIRQALWAWRHNLHGRQVANYKGQVFCNYCGDINPMTRTKKK